MSFVTKLAAAAAVSMGLVGSIESAEAWGLDLSRAPEQPRYERFINHYIYKPRYVHLYHTAPQGDPYAYRYARRAYYPYYGSQYWVASEQMRNRYRYHWAGPKYEYHPSWGRTQANHHHHAERHAPMKPTK
jgi:hypothetical protein